MLGAPVPTQVQAPAMTNNAQVPGDLTPEELQWLMQSVQGQGKQPLGGPATMGPQRPPPGMPDPMTTDLERTQ